MKVSTSTAQWTGTPHPWHPVCLPVRDDNNMNRIEVDPKLACICMQPDTYNKMCLHKH